MVGHGRAGLGGMHACAMLARRRSDHERWKGRGGVGATAFGFRCCMERCSVRMRTLACGRAQPNSEAWFQMRCSPWLALAQEVVQVPHSMRPVLGRVGREIGQARVWIAYGAGLAEDGGRSQFGAFRVLHWYARLQPEARVSMASTRAVMRSGCWVGDQVVEATLCVADTAPAREALLCAWKRHKTPSPPVTGRVRWCGAQRFLLMSIHAWKARVGADASIELFARVSPSHCWLCESKRGEKTGRMPPRFRGLGVSVGCPVPPPPLLSLPGRRGGVVYRLASRRMLRSQATMECGEERGSEWARKKEKEIKSNQ